MIPYGKQKITKSDIKAVVEVLESDFITQGNCVPEFEQALCRYTSAKHAVAVNSATSALHIACLSLGLEKGDCVWTSPVTFVASANCARLCGAEVDFVDIDQNTYNLSIDALRKKLLIAKKNNKLPKILIPVHLCGASCDMQAIKALSKEYGFYIIEDASHAIGGRYQEQAIGCCQYSDITVFSFHPVKIITTGEGGAALTNKKILAEKMTMLRSHGVTRNDEYLYKAAEGPWYYEQHILGQNYRLTDIQAALGMSQFKRIDQMIDSRNHLASRYDKLLSKLPLKLPYRDNNFYSSYHLYIIRLNLSKIKISHKEVFELLRKKNIGVNLHYIPVYKQPYYQSLGFPENYCNQAEEYYKEAITLPLFPELTLNDQNHIVHAIKEIVL